MRLDTVLRCNHPVRVAFTGAGGKTTAMFRLARELPKPVLVTASTHLGDWQLGQADRHWVIENPKDVTQLKRELVEDQVVLITGHAEVDGGRVNGASNEVLSALRKLADERSWPLLIEADGSRQKPVKAPAGHEPAVPDWVNCVVVTAGLSVLGKPLTDEYVHRPIAFSSLAGVDMGSIVTATMLARVLVHPQGGLQGIPENAKRIVLLNQADTSALVREGLVMAGPLLEHFDLALISSLEKQEVIAARVPIGGIILAAGGATRFGKAKVLLDWNGRPFVRSVAETALSAGLTPVRVVAGEHVEAIRSALSGLPVEVVVNHEWHIGQNASVRTGLSGIPERCGAVIFLLADQPQIDVSHIRRLIDIHGETLAPIVAPRVNGRRANPVLFDRAMFDDLRSIKGDKGGRDLLSRYDVVWYESDDPKLLMDVDTPEDYETLLRLSRID